MRGGESEIQKKKNGWRKGKKKTSNHSELHPKKKRKSHKSSIKEGNLERTNLASPERKEKIQKKKDPNQYTDASQ